jgi:predicted RNA-binding protein with TRAM domain
MTRYRRYSNPYSVDVQRFSIYHREERGSGKRVLQVGDEVNVTISEMDELGRGVVHYRGIRIAVPKAVPGERVRIRITRVEGNAAQATVIKRIAEPKR